MCIDGLPPTHSTFPSLLDSPSFPSLGSYIPRSLLARPCRVLPAPASPYRSLALGGLTGADFAQPWILTNNLHRKHT